MTFVDEVRVAVRGGRGGDGSSAMLSEPFKPRGGPNGGDGGDGGDVVFEVSRVVGSDNMTGDALFLGMKLMVTYNAGNDA